MFNPVIIVAIIIQSLIAKASRIAGAIVGYIITTGIFFWGLSVYAEGNEIMLFKIPLSEGVFILACLVWYGFDTKEFIAARKVTSALENALKSPLLEDPRVIKFYETTLESWNAGTLSMLSKNFQTEVKTIDYDGFVKKYLPLEGSALHNFFTQFPPLDGEFLVGLGNSESGTDRGWFVLTNLRLVQKDGRDNMYKEVKFDDVSTHAMSGTLSKTLTFAMRTGQIVDFEKVQIFPTEKFLSEMIQKRITA